ncbi:MAG: hypothetical protein IKT00_09365 [Prevotella sp.]|nr:hypothetical protein [Prevotella sp.]
MEKNEFINEQEFDDLIAETLERQAMVDDLNCSVMKELNRAAHRERWRRWGRLVVVAFGLPVLLALFAYFIVQGWYAGHGTKWAAACLSIQVIGVLLGMIAFMGKYRHSSI